MRKQTTRVHTGAVKTKLGIALVLILAAVLGIAVYDTFNPTYTPPPFEPTAVTGVPAPPENMGYDQISTEGGFSFSIASTMYQQQDQSLLVYLTNPEDSGINLLCEIRDPQGDVLYKSGALRPGEYVERLQPLKKIPNEAMKIEMNVYAFVPDTWYSKGTISLANMLQAY